MPTGCCVPLCSNQKGGHTFPSNPEIKKKWLQKIKRLCKHPESGKIVNWIPTKHSVVCADHFTESDYKDVVAGE